MCSKKVREWLVLLTMEKYLHSFLERGYESIAQCRQIINSDLVMLGIDDPTHRKLLIDGVQLLINSGQLFSCAEPCELHLTEELQEDKDYNFFDAELLVPTGYRGYSPNRSLEEEEDNWQMDGMLDANKEDLNLTTNLRASFTCVACPHLKFAQLYELDEHIANLKYSNDPSAAKHKYGNHMIVE